MINNLTINDGMQDAKYLEGPKSQDVTDGNLQVGKKLR